MLPFEVMKIMQSSFISKSVEDSEGLWPLCEVAFKPVVSVPAWQPFKKVFWNGGSSLD